MISLEDLARTISDKSNQNGFNTDWEWNGEAVNLQFTTQGGRPGPTLTLTRNNLRQPVGLLNGKRFGPWPNEMETFAWGRFWRAVREASGIAARKPQHDFGHGRR